MIYFVYFSFFCIHLELFGVEKINKFIQCRGLLPRKSYSILDRNGQKRLKTTPVEAAHTHICGVLPTPGRVLCKLESSSQSVLYREWVIISVKKLLSQ